MESGLRPPQFSPEPSVWEDGGRGSVGLSEKKEKVVVTGMYVPADEESAVAGTKEGGEGIQTTMRT